MLNIFLSASIPLSNRKKCFYETADVLAIKEAVRSLVEVVIPNGRIVCGGHTAMMCAELAGDFHLGDSRQLTDKSLLPFDLVS